VFQDWVHPPHFCRARSTGDWIGSINLIMLALTGWTSQHRAGKARRIPFQSVVLGTNKLVTLLGRVVTQILRVFDFAY